MWYLHTIKYYSALKKKEILLYTTTWMDFEDIMLSEISQSQKDKYCMSPLMWGPRAVKFIEIEGRMMVARVWE